MHKTTMLFAGLALAAAAAARGDDWAQWRGPGGMGISKETHWKHEALAAGPKIAWRASVGNGYSSMTAAAKRVYTMGGAGGTDTVFCLDAETGNVIWRHDYPCRKGQPRSTPVVDGAAVYALSQEGLAMCLDAETGAFKWQRDLAKEHGAGAPKWGFSDSALVLGEAVLFNAGVSGLALNRQTGEPVWTSGPGVGGYATPVRYETGSGPGALIFARDRLYGVRLADGKPLWAYPWTTAYDVNAPDPLPFDGKVFITSGYGRGGTVLDLGAGEPKALWENKLIASHFGSCVLIGGHIYGISGNTGRKDATLCCLEALTGREAWSQAVGFGSLIAAGDRLIVLLDGGMLLVAAADPAGYRELARGKVLSGQCWTAPIFSDGRVYARNTPGELVCVDLR